jgi:hypothetical protein
MLEDDHYIPNPKNAHIDTSAFELHLRKQLSGGKCGVEEALESVYNLAFSTFGAAPKEPDDDKLICRYLSPIKFLQFLHTRRVNFSAATQFSDHWECRVPEDYEVVVLRILSELGISAEAWSRLVKRKAACWSVSCWTQLDDYFDDHLMWSAYAGGPQGVGVTVRYGVLKDSLAKSVGQLAADGVLHSGSVNYETLSLLPFNKHYMFRKEREVRFAFGTKCSRAHSVSVDDIFDSFGVRISPAATIEHRNMVSRLWLSFGGVDRVQWPQ